MKPLKHFVKYAILSIAPVFFVIACTGEKLTLNPDNGGGTTETTSGNVLGTIWNVDGTPAAEVSVRLTPVNFSPYFARDTFTIDSTTTDENGAYSFKLKSSGFFNMSAQGNGKYCYEDSIYGSKNGHMKVRDDTLKAPGSISGVARLLPGEDNRQIIILALGTNTYASPRDSSGAFTISALAEGKYLLRILSTNKDYGFIDTVLTVTSGENTTIPGIVRLPFEGVPAVGEVAAQLDLHSMIVTLSWPACDTSKIAAFYLFRNTGTTSPPFAIINCTDTIFKDDVLLLNPDSLAYGDTLRYSMAAVGKNRTLGRLCPAPDVLLRNFLGPIDTIPLMGINLVNLESAGIQADKNHNIYLYGFYGNGGILKIDPRGQVIAQYTYTDTFDCTSYSHIVVDGNENVYALHFPVPWETKPAPRILEKFSPDLKLLATKLVDSVISPGMINRIASNGNGLTYLFLWPGNIPDNNGPINSTFIQVFDSTLSLVQSDTIHENWQLSQMYNDTFIVRNYPNFRAGSNVFKAYDSHFHYLRTLAFNEMVDYYCPSSFKGSDYIENIYFSANNTALIVFTFLNVNNIVSKIVLAIDSRNKLLGRCNFIGDSYAFDGVDRLYVYNYSAQAVYIYKID